MIRVLTFPGSEEKYLKEIGASSWATYSLLEEMNKIRLTCRPMGHIALVVIVVTIILVPYHPRQDTATHLKNGYPQMESTELYLYMSCNNLT